MFCAKCGQQMAAGATRCALCGYVLPGPLPTTDLGQDPAFRMLLPVGRSIWAILAGYLGLLSPLFVFAPFAVLCGVMGIIDIKAHPDRHGMGRAIFGLVMGVPFTIFLLLAIAAGVISMMGQQ
jgi:uncharacterized protein DUF4190